MTIKLDNAQFKQFVQFAENQANPGKSEAIARLAGGSALTGRTITASDTDHVRGWLSWGRRSGTDATENNDARALFREAVFSMFGGEANVPDSVKTAMRLEDYDQGKPLTARRIIAVRDAVLQAADGVKEGAVARQKAESLVNDAIANFDKELLAKKDGQMLLGNNLRDKVIGAVAKYGVGLTDKCQRILANYLVPTMFSKRGDEADKVDQMAAFLADALKNVRDFKPGEDYRLSELDREVKEYLSCSIANGQKPFRSGHYDEDGLFDEFKTDASKTEFTIDGQHFARDKANAGPIADKFKATIANPQHRKVISTVLNRGLKTIIANTQTREDLPSVAHFRQLNLANVKGSEMLLTVPKENPLTYHQGIVSRYLPELTLSVTGNKAKVTCTVRGDLEFNCKFASPKWLEMRMGKIENSIECEFDLSDPNNAVLTSVHFGQTIEA
jgi:hypothetical protein